MQKIRYHIQSVWDARKTRWIQNGCWEDSARPRQCSAPQDADVVLVNTCGFIEPAVSESSRSSWTRLRNWSISDPRPLLVVTGCLVNRYGQDLRVELPEVDLFLEISRTVGTWHAGAGHAHLRDQRMDAVSGSEALRLRAP